MVSCIISRFDLLFCPTGSIPQEADKTLRKSLCCCLNEIQSIKNSRFDYYLDEISDVDGSSQIT